MKTHTSKKWNIFGRLKIQKKSFVKGTKCWQTFVQFFQKYVKINAHMMKKNHDAVPLQMWV